MKTVAEYRDYAESCRKLAARLSDAKDKQAVLMMAAANEREAELQRKV
jgi:hypothetical protein